MVGLGTGQDSDAGFLKDVARRGNGMIYFSDRADELPRIFAQDTFLMARNTFVDTPVEADYTAALRSVSQADFGRSAGFGGYNLCYGREGAEILLVPAMNSRRRLPRSGRPDSAGSARSPPRPTGSTPGGSQPIRWPVRCCRRWRTGC